MAIDTELRTEIEQAVAAAFAKIFSQHWAVDAALDLTKLPTLDLRNLPTLDLPALAERSQELQAAIKSRMIDITDLFPTPAQVAISQPDTTYIEPFVRVVARAVEVLGTSEKALRWIRTPVRSLGDRTPLSMLDSPEGLVSVEASLTRIEHGVW